MKLIHYTITNRSRILPAVIVVESGMTALPRQRIATAVRARMRELNLNPERLADKAGVGATTIRRLLRGEGWPQEHTRNALEDALQWPAGEFVRLAGNLHTVSCTELRAELTARCAAT